MVEMVVGDLATPGWGGVRPWWRGCPNVPHAVPYGGHGDGVVLPPPPVVTEQEAQTALQLLQACPLQERRDAIQLMNACTIFAIFFYLCFG